VLFVGPEFIDQVRGIQAKLPSVRAFMTIEGGAPQWPDYLGWRDAQSSDDPMLPLTEQGIALQLYTSGTTLTHATVQAQSAASITVSVKAFAKKGSSILYDRTFEPLRGCKCSGRRNFLKTAAAATALGLVGGAVFSAPAPVDVLTKGNATN
jgi:hypothetical protein